VLGNLNIMFHVANFVWESRENDKSGPLVCWATHYYSLVRRVSPQHTHTYTHTHTHEVISLNSRVTKSLSIAYRTQVWSLTLPCISSQISNQSFLIKNQFHYLCHLCSRKLWELKDIRYLIQWAAWSRHLVSI
jgi:hypothetical protein